MGKKSRVWCPCSPSAAGSKPAPLSGESVSAPSSASSAPSTGPSGNPTGTKVARDTCARQFGDVGLDLQRRDGAERAGTPIGPYDVLVAAQARRRDALLVTANEREFARVPRLKFEDWAIPE